MRSRARPPRRRARPAIEPQAAPVEALIDRLGDAGDGVAETSAGKIWVPFTVPGDRVLARPGPARGDGRAAELLSIAHPGPGRAEPVCPHFSVCGGCSVQHLRDDIYVEWKLDRLRRSLERVGLSGWAMAPVARTGPGGRRRVTFSLRRAAEDRISAGFLRRSSHAVVDVSACPVIDPMLMAVLPAARRLLAGQGAPASVSIAATLLDGGLDLVALLPSVPDLDMRERLVEFARETDAARVSWRPTDGVWDAETVVQARPVGASFGGVFVALPAGGFVQASVAGERALVEEVMAATAGASRVADLFSGAGTFALPLAAAGARVRAVDGDAASLAALAAAARAHPPIGARLACEHRDLFSRPLSPAELSGLDAVVFDPPRAGAAAQAAALARSDVRVIVAVSCNLATFARDARTLADGGWRLRRVLPVDQFLWSAHLEVVATFERDA